MLHIAAFGVQPSCSEEAKALEKEQRTIETRTTFYHPIRSSGRCDEACGETPTTRRHRSAIKRRRKSVLEATSTPSASGTSVRNLVGRESLRQFPRRSKLPATRLQTTAVSSDVKKGGISKVDQTVNARNDSHIVRSSSGRRRTVTNVAFLGLCCALIGFPAGTLATTTGVSCDNAELLGSEEEFNQTPRNDTSTEAVAVGIDQTVVASQETYDRLRLDQVEIAAEEGRDLPALRNLWSDRLWLGTVTVSFESAEYLASYMESTLPQFRCMNDHYELDFKKLEAEETSARGRLSSEKVLNWSLLAPTYTTLAGITGFEPTPESVVELSMIFVAARRFEDQSYHYFLSERASDIDDGECPEPCTGRIVTYYWSVVPGTIYALDRASTNAEPAPCWMPVYQEVEEGPPEGGVTSWDSACLEGLVQMLEDDKEAGAWRNGERPDGHLETGEKEGGMIENFEKGFLLIFVGFATAIFILYVGLVLLKFQRTERMRKIQSTEEGWREGMPGCGRPAVQKSRCLLGALASGATRIDGFRRERARPDRAMTNVTLDDLDAEEEADLV